MRMVASLAAVVFALVMTPAINAFPLPDSRIRSCYFENAPELQPLNDERFVRIFTQVIADFKLDVESFAICTNTTETMPATYIKRPNGKKIAVVTIPRYALELSDKAARGLLGHEVGHIVVGAKPYSIENEIDVDLVAAETVGYDAVIASHHEMNALLAIHSPFDLTSSAPGEQGRERIDALIKHKHKAGLP